MTILFWLYKSRASKTVEVPIMMRISMDGKRVSFSTDLFTDPKSWDQGRQKIKGASRYIRYFHRNFERAALFGAALFLL
jgi:hypothetical protein